jgi:hypothetical protein
MLRHNGPSATFHVGIPAGLRPLPDRLQAVCPAFLKTAKDFDSG